MRQFELEHIPHLEVFQHRIAEVTLRQMANMQLHRIALMRRIGHGIAAALPIGQQQLQILTRFELDTHARRKAQLQLRHIGGQLNFFEHLGLHGFACSRVYTLPAFGCNGQITRWLRTAKQMLVGLGDARLVRAALSTRDQFTLHQATFAVATHAFAAGVRHVNALTHGGIQQVFGRRAVKRDIAALNLNLETHA